VETLAGDVAVAGTRSAQAFKGSFLVRRTCLAVDLVTLFVALREIAAEVNWTLIILTVLDLIMSLFEVAP